MIYSKKCPQGVSRLFLIIIGLSLVTFTLPLRAAESSSPANSPVKVDIEQTAFNAPHAAEKNGTGSTTVHGGVPSVLSNPWLALVMVIGLILIAAWVFRKFTAGGNMLFGSLPVLQVLGRTHLSSKQTIALLKLDNKLLLIGITDHQITPLLTLDNPEDISRILTQIEQNRPAGISSGFRNLFSRENREFEDEKDPSNPISVDSSDKNAENGVFQLKNELNTLLNKIQKMKGNGR